LFPIHADADFFAILILHDGKDDRRNIKIMKEGIDDFHLFSCRPDDVFLLVSENVAKKSAIAHLVGMAG
jgi:hypothetical protein